MGRLHVNVRRAIVALASGLLGIVATPAGGEEISLAAALALAREENPALAAAASRAEAAAQEATATARAANWPRIAWSGGWTVTDQPSAVFAQRLDAGVLSPSDIAFPTITSPAAHGHLGTALALELPVDLFGKAAPQRQAAAAQARAVGAAADEAKLEVLLQVTAAWYRALVAARAVGATERALAGAAAREGEVDKQVAEGAALRADLLRARARRRQLEAELASRGGERRTALAALQLAVGTDRELEPAGAATTPAAPADLARWLAAAAERPAVRAAADAAQGAAARARGEARSARPDLLLSAQLRDDRGPFDSGQTSAGGGVLLRWGLYDPQRAARRAAATSARDAAEGDLAAAHDRVRFEVEAAWHAVAAAHQRWLAARGGSEEGAEALRVVRERRAAGLATLTDELETEAVALAAELAELAAAAEAEVSAAALARAAGRLPPGAGEPNAAPLPSLSTPAETLR
jgi:outer membrane protein TolC